MPVTIEKTDQELLVELDGTISIWEAHDVASRLYEQLKDELLPAERVTRVRTAQLKSIDSSGLQILCSLLKSVTKLVFEQPSTEFLGAVDHCGLRRELLGWIGEAV